MAYPKLQASIDQEHNTLPLRKIASSRSPREFAAVKIPEEIESKPKFSCRFLSNLASPQDLKTSYKNEAVAQLNLLVKLSF
jgi:hypothetical protein